MVAQARGNRHREKINGNMVVVGECGSSHPFFMTHDSDRHGKISFLDHSTLPPLCDTTIIGMDGPKALLRTPSMNEVLAAIEKGDIKGVLRVLEAEGVHDTFLPTFALIEAAERGKLDDKGFRSIFNCGVDLQDAIESAMLSEHT